MCTRACMRVCMLMQFLEGKLKLDQIDLNPSDGTFGLGDLDINCQALNNALGDVAPLRVVRGVVSSIRGKIPYTVRGTLMHCLKADF